ncbi:MAG: hypothetical protein AB7N80_11960 [Bdellovibrionales bacterium]
MGQDKQLKRTVMKICLSVVLLGVATPATAQVAYEANGVISASRTRAAFLYNRLTGQKAPIDSQVIKDMEALINAGDQMGAARIATNQPTFYSQTVRLLGSKMSTRAGVYRVPMNDLTATVIGFTKDDLDARGLLTTNSVYRFENIPNLRINPVNDIARSNNHYNDVDAALALNPVMDIRPNLVSVQQTIVDDNQASVNHPDAAGLLTTRQFMSDCADAGTNRRCYEKVVKRLTCHTLEEVVSTSLPDDRVGRDVSRAPGGDPSAFLLTCKGCHSNMDAHRSAFAYSEFDNNQVKHGQVNLNTGLYDGTTRVANKLNRLGEGQFNQGQVVANDNWVNYAVTPELNELYGWRDAQGRPVTTPIMGRGLNAYGTMLSRSEAFSRCVAENVFENVCRRSPTASEKAAGGALRALARDWENPAMGNYKLRWLFERVATSAACSGQ